MALCLAAVVFACTALRNAAAEPEALPPGVGGMVQELVDELAARSGMEAHASSRDWKEVERRREEILSRIQPVDQLDADLDADPNSWRNLRRSLDD
jgi:hypothetical protein